VTRPYRILVLCTANRCRSPIAEALLARHLATAGVLAAVRSAGILEPGQAAWPEAAAVMAERDVDLSAHASRRMERVEVAGADVVLGMTREHVREAVALDPRSFKRTFTLKELVRRAEELPRQGAFGDWLEALAAHRQVTELLGSSPIDDIADPIGMPMRAFRATAAEIDELAARLVDLAFVPR
jgi:protein-tyrosine phosphatase